MDADMLAILSPTRKIIGVWKGNDPVNRAERLRTWSSGLFIFELSIIPILSLVDVSMLALVGLILYYAFSRCNEIAIAFYKDTFRILRREQPDSSLNAVDRTKMAMRSYLGLIVNFALLYYFLPIDNLFNVQFRDFFQAIYYSTVTLTTLGYGEIHPKHFVSELIAMYQVLLGLLILLVAVATYIGSSNDETRI